MYRAENRSMDNASVSFCHRVIAGQLPQTNALGPVLEIRGKVKIKGRKVVVEATVFAEGVATSAGQKLSRLQMPDTFTAK